MRRIGALLSLAALCACGGAPPRPDPYDAALRAALRDIDEASVMRDIERWSGPRHAWAAPAHLAAVADDLSGELADAGLSVERQAVQLHGATADNVVAERRGAEPERVILVGAHYDTVAGSPGADDNASGLAALLATARAAARLPTRATIRVVAFAFEEQGLVGSARYVESLGAEGRRRVEVALILDMIAYRSHAPGSQRSPPGSSLLSARPLPTVGDFLGGMWLSDTPSDVVLSLRGARVYAPGLRAEWLEVPRLATRIAPDLLRSDHAPFWGARIPAVLLGDTANFRNPHYHGPGDTPETLDPGFAASAVRFVAAAALVLADRPR